VNAEIAASSSFSKEEPRMNENAPFGTKSTAAVAGHPLHPVFIVFPIAFFIGALITDIAFWATKNTCWSMMSFWLIVFGVVGSVFSALTGFIEFITLQPVRMLLIGWTHAIGNVLAVAAAVANWALRLNPQNPPTSSMRIILSVITVVILAFTGWWGGELAYRHGIGVTAKPEKQH
jgi:uncharacterized membrane protein